MITINILMVIMLIYYYLLLAVSSADVKEIIFSLRNNPGNINIYTFSNSVLKRISRYVCHVLCHIINLSLRSGIFSQLFTIRPRDSHPKRR